MAAAATQRAIAPAAMSPTMETSVATILDPEQVARLAYSYWESRGGEGGSADEDWYRAEAELRLGGQPTAAGTDGA